MNSASRIDDSLTWPLQGSLLIEASAGTGKTFALAGLYLRAVLERGLMPRQIAVVTFTEAAARELRARIHRRLSIAIEVLQNDRESNNETDSEAIWFSHWRQNQTTPDPRLWLQRLQLARLELGEAPVQTIHGFCRAVLSDHGWVGGWGGNPIEVQADAQDLMRDLARRVRRMALAELNPMQRSVLLTLWPSLRDLHESLETMLGTSACLMPAATSEVDPVEWQHALDAREHVARQWHAAFERDAHAAIETLRQWRMEKRISGQTFQDRYLESAFTKIGLAVRQRSVRDWVSQSKSGTDLKLLSARFVSERALKELPDLPELFHLADAVVAAESRVRDLCARTGAQVLAWVRARALRLNRERLQANGPWRYDDLLNECHQLLDDSPAAERNPSAATTVTQELAERYPLILIDEFQDTDPRQWAIFRSIHRARTHHGLILVGDPKQAIYGFRGGDLETYLAARRSMQTHADLPGNRRSTVAMLRALEVVYADAKSDAFKHDAVQLMSVQAHAAHRDAMILDAQGHALPALRVMLAVGDDDEASEDNTDEEAAAAEEFTASRANEETSAAHGGEKSALTTRVLNAMALDIQSLLHHGKRPDALDSNALTSVEADQIAVLVNTNAQVSLVMQALLQQGIGAAAKLQQALFDSSAALDWLVILQAVQAPTSLHYLNALNALPWFRANESSLRLSDAVASSEWRMRLDQWRDRLESAGPLAMWLSILDFVATQKHAPSLPAQHASDAMHIAECLQTQGEWQVDALKRLLQQARVGKTKLARVMARPVQQSKRVAVMTIHGAKGLEFDLVYLPFVLHGKKNRTSIVQVARWREAERECLHLHHKQIFAAHETEWDQAKANARLDEHAEWRRLLYVAMTRARFGVVLGLAYRRTWFDTAFGSILEPHPKQTKNPKKGEPKLTASERCERAVRAWCVKHEVDLTEVSAPSDEPTAIPKVQDARWLADPIAGSSRQFEKDWKLHSFSAWSAGAYEPVPDWQSAWAESEGAEDSLVFSGNRFGAALHGLLETLDFAAWQHLDARNLIRENTMALASALRQHRFAAADLDQGVETLARMLTAVARSCTPDGFAMASITPENARPEFEFHLRLPRVDTAAWCDVLNRIGFEPEARLLQRQPRVLDGMLHGFVDLVYQHQSRFSVLDYKSNRLPSSDPRALDELMRAHHYRLQGLLYAYALHRWLRLNDPQRYLPEQHLGSMHFMFVRGLPDSAWWSMPIDPLWMRAMDAVFQTEELAA